MPSLLPWIAAAALWLMLGQAFAQPAATVTFDPSKPTEFDADRVDLLDGQLRILAEGNVVISQPGVILTAERMELVRDPVTEEIKRLEALGRVRYATVSGDAMAGDEALYTAAENTLTVTGNVVLLQNGQVATGSRLVYNTVTGAMQLTAEPGTRVRGLLPERPGR